jgi:hypothetical protein
MNISNDISQGNVSELSVTGSNDIKGTPLFSKTGINSKKLLICAGDSWTWGDSLGRIKFNPECDDFEWRTTHIYGSLLAKRCDRDFVNLGLPGHSNLSIIDWVFLKLIPEYTKQYEDIVIVITLTEICREVYYDQIWTQQCNNYSSLNEFLEMYETAMFNTLEHYQDMYPKCTIKIGRNFTYTFEKNLIQNKIFHFDKTWIDILAENQQSQSHYPRTLRLLSQMATQPLIRYLKETEKFQMFKQDLVNLMIDGLDAITWMDASPLNNKIATRHPNEQGHELWANYLYEQCKDIL